VEHDGDEGDEIDPVVAASDAQMIDEAMREIAGLNRLSPLTDEDVKLGQYSVGKVNLLYKKENIVNTVV
jgi:hypothetical protein